MKVTIDVEHCIECPYISFPYRDDRDRVLGQCAHPSRKLPGYSAYCSPSDTFGTKYNFPPYCPLLKLLKEPTKVKCQKAIIGIPHCIDCPYLSNFHRESSPLIGQCGHPSRKLQGYYANCTPGEATEEYNFPPYCPLLKEPEPAEKQPPKTKRATEKQTKKPQHKKEETQP